MDPAQQAIEAAKVLGAGSAQTILAYVAVFAVVAGGIAIVWLGRKLFNEIKACSAERREELLKAADSNNALARAMEGLAQTIRARP